MIKITHKTGSLKKLMKYNARSRESWRELEALALLYDEKDNRILDVGIHGDVWPGGHSYMFDNATYETLDIDLLVKPTHVADIRDMPFEDETFDMIICHSVIEHVLENRKEAYKELYRVLKIGGVIVYVIPIQMEAREVEPASFVSITEFRHSHKGKDYTVTTLSDRTYFIVVRK